MYIFKIKPGEEKSKLSYIEKTYPSPWTRINIDFYLLKKLNLNLTQIL